MSRKVVNSKREICIDNISGSIISDSSIVDISVKQEPDYYKVYIKDVSSLYGLNSSEKDLISCLSSKMGYGNVIVLIKSIKELICSELGMSLNTLNKAISELVKCGLLVRQAKCVYLINPYFAAKGKWGEIDKLRLQIDYSSSGRKITLSSGDEALCSSETKLIGG